VADQAHGHTPQGPVALLALGALGIVYGDIGTSPPYAFRETFHGQGHELAVTEPLPQTITLGTAIEL
jgi:KUP system potassium uptake protein